jgi:hypothetical protein
MFAFSMTCGGLCFASILACWIIQFALIDGINSKVNERSRFSYLSRDYSGIFREHSRLYPHSRLRVLFVVFLLLAPVSVLGFVLVQIIQ